MRNAKAECDAIPAGVATQATAELVSDSRPDGCFGTVHFRDSQQKQTTLGVAIPLEDHDDRAL